MNIITSLIVRPLVFLVGFAGVVGGGGGLISPPAYLFAGIPARTAIGTSKFSAVFGTTLATGCFAKQGMIEKWLTFPAVAATLVDTPIGARLFLRMPERMTLIILFVILSSVALLVLNKKLPRDRSLEEEQITGYIYMAVAALAFLVGIYDGLYGPGTNTFLIMLLNVWSRLGSKSANGQVKTINLATNLGLLIVFLMHDTVLIPLGLSAVLCNMIGTYFGAELALKRGSKVIRPILLLVLMLLFIKIISQLPVQWEEQGWRLAFIRREVKGEQYGVAFESPTSASDESAASVRVATCVTPYAQAATSADLESISL